MILLDSWKDTVNVFNKDSVSYFFSKFILNYFGSVKNFTKYFGWLFFLDTIVFLVASVHCKAFIDLYSGAVQNYSFCSIFFKMGLSFFWYLINGVYFLCVRIGNKNINWHSFKIYLKRYIQITVLLILFVYLSHYFLILMGITAFPKLHWILKLIIKFLEIVTVFYWLDSEYKLKDIFLSIEKSINFLLYNLPFFILLICIGLSFNYLIKFIFLFFAPNMQQSVTLGTLAQIKHLLLTFNKFDLVFYLKILAVKYLKFFANYIVLTIIYSYYFFRKNKNYTESVWDN